jgi:hypothetical protein
MAHVTKAERKAAQSPASSWWLNPETFYEEARKRFPDDSPAKSHMPVPTFGAYERGWLAIGRERIRDRAERAERR